MRKICKKRIFFWNNQKEQAGVGIINDGQYPLKINKKMQKEVDDIDKNKEKSDIDKKALPKTHQKRVKKVVTTNNTPIAVEPQKTHKTSVIKHIVKKPVKRKTIKEVKQELDKQEVNKTEENKEKPPFIGFTGKKEENK